MMSRPKHVSTAWILCFLSVSLLASADGSAPVVDLGYAQYEGTFNSDSNTTNFLGIQFAAAPTGPLRWKVPHPPPHINSLQKADKFSPLCKQPPATFGLARKSLFLDNQADFTFDSDNVQANLFMDPPINPGVGAVNEPFPDTNQTAEPEPNSDGISEDCLYLNVYTPGENLQASLPVLVWIHGGGYFVGGGFAHGPDLIRQANHEIVVVVIQYRLGIFGFLSSSEVKENGVLNAGLLDQDFALKWVQDHIRAFGGDPTKVTIWGESAGAGSVIQHVVARGGKMDPPLFRAALTTSTFMPSQYNYNDRIPESIYQQVVSQAHCTSSKDTLDCLRQVDTDVLNKIGGDINAAMFFGTFIFAPVVDGSFIVERPSLTLSKKQHNGDVLLAVTNTFEGGLFANVTEADAFFVPIPGTGYKVTDGPPLSDITEYISNLFPELPIEHAKTASEHYERTGLTKLEQVVAIYGETILICPSYYLLNAFGNGSAWRGEYAILPAVHADEMAYYWPPSNGGPAYNNTEFTKSFVQSFTSVVMSLDPNVKYDPQNTRTHWKPWDEREHNEMLFNKTETDVPRIEPFSTDTALYERCMFWQSVGKYTGH